MRKLLWLTAVTGSVIAVGLAAIPSQAAAAQDDGKTKCGERANPVDGQTEHRFQQEGICVSGGERHEAWWLAPCIPENHQSAPC